MLIKEFAILFIGYPIATLIGVAIMAKIVRSNKTLRRYVKELMK